MKINSSEFPKINLKCETCGIVWRTTAGPFWMIKPGLEAPDVKRILTANEIHPCVQAGHTIVFAKPKDTAF